MNTLNIETKKSIDKAVTPYESKSSLTDGEGVIVNLNYISSYYKR